MDRGRRTLLRLSLQRDPGQAGGPLSDTSSNTSDDTDCPSPVHADVDIVSVAKRAAVAAFFTGLADFCSITSTPPSSVKFTSSEAGENHPLLRIRPRPVVETVVMGPEGTPLPGPRGGSIFFFLLYRRCIYTTETVQISVYVRETTRECIRTRETNASDSRLRIGQMVRECRAPGLKRPGPQT